MTTQFASASYQEVVDLHTESDTVSVIGIHTPQGDTPRKMFGGFFEQFKKFKYLGCSIKLVPAARLPADPLQVSYDAGEPTIDPRDMLNPLMFHGCHGNDMGVILNRLYALNSADRNSDSVDFVQNNIEWSLADIAEGKFPNFQLEELYYKALTDNTWKKAHPQRGFRKSGLRPLVYKMATNLQMLGAGSSLVGEVGVDGIPMGPAYDSGSISLPVTQSGRQFFTPGLTGLGWLDTRNVLTDYKSVEIDLPITEEEIPDLEAAIRNATLAQQNVSESSLPLVYMGMILLPPAYKTEQYFRMVINHHFAFKDFRGISFSNNLAVTPAYDNFNADESEDPDDPDPPTPPEPDPPVGGTDLYLSSARGSSLVHDGGVVNCYIKWGVEEDTVTSDPPRLTLPLRVTTDVLAIWGVCVDPDANPSEVSYLYGIHYSNGDTVSEQYKIYIDSFEDSTHFDVWIATENSNTWYLLSRDGVWNPSSVSQVNSYMSDLHITSSSTAISFTNGNVQDYVGYGAVQYEVVS